MKRLLMTTAALALLATTAHAQQAPPPIALANTGYWKTFLYPQNEAGHPMCDMESTWKFADGSTGSFYIKYPANRGGIFTQIIKSSWRLPDDIEVPLKLSLEAGPAKGALTTTGTIHNSKWGSVITAYVPIDDTLEFLNDVGEADELKVEFPQGNEPTWTGKMFGSRVAKNWFVACMAKLNSVASSKTQPVVPNASQPVTKPAKKDDGGI